MSQNPSRKQSARGRTPAAQARVADLERQRAAARRKRIGLGTGVTVVVVVVALIIARVAVGGQKATAAPVADGGSVYSQIAAVPVSTIDAVAAGSNINPPKSLNGAPPISDNGKPRVVYVGAEYCPYCAAERWPLVQALSRFGTFTGLQTTRSSSTDVYPSTATLDVKDATYSSPYLSWAGYEVEDGTGKPLQKPSADVQALFDRYSGGGFPFADLGGTTVTGVSYDPAVLKGLDQAQIARDLAKPDTAVSKAVVGAANSITKQLCTLTKQQPAQVCSASGVQAAA